VKQNRIFAKSKIASLSKKKGASSETPFIVYEKLLSQLDVLFYESIRRTIKQWARLEQKDAFCKP